MRTPQLLGYLVLPVVPITAIALWFGLSTAENRPRTGPWMRPLAERKGDPFPRTFTNAAGETARIVEPPRRIVSATVFSDALLLAVCPRERLQSLHVISKDPRYSPVSDESARFPRHTTGDSEDILSMNPDLVILSSFSRKETVRLISSEKCAVLRFMGFDSVADIHNNMRALGYALGLDTEMEKLIEDMQATLDSVAERRDARAAWKVLHYGDGRVSGSKTTFGSLLTIVGAHNLASDLGVEGFERVGVEDLLLVDPDVLVIGVTPGDEERKRKRLSQIPGFDGLRAVRKGRLLFVPDSWLQSTSHHLARAVERIAETLDRWGKP